MNWNNENRFGHRLYTTGAKLEVAAGALGGLSLGPKVGLGSSGAGSSASRTKPSSSIENDDVLPKPISWPDLSKMNMVGELHCAAAVAAEAAAVAAAAGGGRWYSTSIERRPSTKQWHRR
jgi:hypothetical protein